MTKPQYPRRAFEACVEGTVVVLIGIDAEGSVSASKVVQSRDGLDEAAVACVKKWRFKPARKAGVAVGTVALAPIGFRIYDKHKGPGPCTASPGGSQEKPTPRQP
jgi:protein TonB